ncbi:MAG: dTDP-glucose 4,6-dehydratase [bacterium]|nr:dTDP-glucose 4,6-dehydratase [bacterium]
MKRILVTGGAGFIGSNFIQHCLTAHEDLEVINLDKLTYAGNLDNLKTVQSDPRYTFFHGDIGDRQLLMDLISRKPIDAIVNFAAETHVDRSISKPDDFLRTDVFGVFSLLEASRQFGVKKYVQISTDEVYGPALEGPMTETSPLNPSSPYSAGKGGGDLLCRAYYSTYKSPVVIVRMANNYGPYQHPEKLIPLCVTNALENEPLPIYGDGSQMREWLYVEDSCRAIDLVLSAGEPGEIYNIGGQGDMTNLMVVKKILECLKKPEDLIAFVDDRPGHDFRYALDDSKLRALGWKPEVDLDAGLVRTVNWYKKNKDWWKKLKEGDFQAYYKKQYGDRLAKAKKTA